MISEGLTSQSSNWKSFSVSLWIFVFDFFDGNQLPCFDVLCLVDCAVRASADLLDDFVLLRDPIETECSGL